MTVVERVRDVGLLRAAGATRRDINRTFLLQAALIGAAGSLIDLFGGFALAARWDLTADRRTRLDPAALGLAMGRRRTPGLRRIDDVGALAGWLLPTNIY